MVLRPPRQRQLLRLARLLVALALLRAPHCFAPGGRRSGHPRVELLAPRAAQDGADVPSTWAPRHQLGDLVEVRCEDDGKWYQAIVETQNPDGSFMVRFDRAGYEYHYPLTSWRVPKIRHSMAELEEGEMLQGRVTDVSSRGFYVDVGAEDEGFVHISQMRDDVRRVADEVHIGQDVTVRVLSSVNGTLTLSTKPIRSGDLTAFRDLPNGTVLKAKISKIQPFGAFANVQPPQGGLPFQGLIHKSNMGRYVVCVEDVLSLGQEVHVAVINTDNGRLSLELEEREDLSEYASLGNATWIEARVVEIATFGVFLSVPPISGEFSQRVVIGLLPLSEMADYYIEEPRDLVSEGDNILVRVVSTEEGKLVLSAKPVEMEDNLEPFKAVAGQDQLLSGVVASVSAHGAYVMVQPSDGGIACRGFLSKSEVELEEGSQLEEVLSAGQDIEVRVLSAGRGRLMLSLLPVDGAIRLANVSASTWLAGRVKDIRDWGAFVVVEVPFSDKVATGLLHISEIRDGFVENISEVLSLGQEVSVRVIGVDSGRVALTMKGRRRPQKVSKKMEDPGNATSVRPPACPNATSQARTKQPLPSNKSQEATHSPSLEPKKPPFANFSAAEWLPAVVEEVGPFGARLTVNDSATGEAVDGWLHLPEACDSFIGSLRDILQVKQEVKARVISADGNVSLSLRPLPAPLAFNTSQLLNGVVENASDCGAFVRVALEGRDVLGFLPASELPDEKLGDTTAPLAKGEEVAMRALATGAEKLALTMRSADSTSSLASFSTYTSHMWFQGVVQQLTPIGISAVLQPPGGGPVMKGFLHISELAEFTTADIRVGDSIRVRVLDTSSGRLQLSMKPVKQK